jgi:hypothetical protein
LTSKASSYCSGVISPSGASAPVPALANRTSSRPLFGLHRLVQPIEVGQFGHRTAHRPRLGAQLRQRRIERLLPSSEDIDERPFLHEPLGGPQTNAASAAGHHRRLAIQPAHDVLLC